LSVTIDWQEIIEPAIGKPMSYRKILVVISEHTGSTVAAHYAIMLAASGGSKLVLYCAHDEGSDGSAARHTERHIDHLFSEALALDIAVTRISESGPINRLLPYRIQAEGADLVFYPLPPGEYYGASLPRHTAHHLLRTVRADLAVMRIMHMGKPHPHRILMPVGGVVSDREQRVRFVAALAKGFHSQVTLFHLLDIGKQAVPDDFVTLRNELRLHHLPVLERSGSGHIARAIALEAVSHHNDLIVVGASERGTLRRLFFGNPAGDVMFQPPCNAILFRPARQLP
jgi:nucleotide-binding universal stress UspA family protein